MKNVFILLLSLISIGAYATEREFDIEVLIFKRTVEPENVNESWPDTLPEINFDRAGDFSDQEFRKINDIRMLAYEEYQLIEQKEKLDKHAGFEVLLHTAWRQGDVPKSSGPVFHIRAGRDYSENFNPDGSVKEAMITDDINSEIDIASPLYELDGKFQVYVQHYLFLETDLDLKAPGQREFFVETLLEEEVIEDESAMSEVTEETDSMVTDNDVTEAVQVQEDNMVEFGNMEAIEPTIEVETFLKSYRLSQKRRMRSGEVHYLDHPLMGIIIQVRRAPEES